ncbi:MAG: crossover junction endodeoxyribonuclease RuvC [Deltaproteobacteria bacterium]|nr:crossover junction endodeoxyribonuclease RuvC [Deltaproteobacteria bacterium]
MVILGIDPGSLKTGYGLIDVEGHVSQHMSHGVIHLKEFKQLADKLSCLYEKISHVILEFQPQHCAIEKVFYSKNAQSMLKLGEARSVSLLAAIHKGVAIYEYTPLEVKQAAVGIGNAPKEQVQRMIQVILKLSNPPFEDAADALAIAMCHAQTYKFKERIDRAC